MSDDSDYSDEELRDPGTSEAEVDCPYCGEVFTIVVDCSVERQTYIEDCNVCCRPISFTVECEDGALISIMSDRS